ncbi:MAG: HU family DNA-binding protein [Bacteroidetes bacterium]|nr:HU family DNA-binding protein [Bacteroidota bacterium]
MKPRVKTLTKKDVAKKVAEDNDERLYHTSKWVDSTFAALRELMLTTDEEVRIEIRDFGVFEVKITRPKPKARNPKTGDTVYIPWRKKTHFKPSKLIREALQQPLSDEKIKEIMEE